MARRRRDLQTVNVDEDVERAAEYALRCLARPRAIDPRSAASDEHDARIKTVVSAARRRPAPVADQLRDAVAGLEESGLMPRAGEIAERHAARYLTTNGKTWLSPNRSEARRGR